MAKKKATLKKATPRKSPQLGMSGRRLSKKQESTLADKTANSSIAQRAAATWPQLGSARQIGKDFAAGEAKSRVTTKGKSAKRKITLAKNPAWGRDVPLPKSRR